MAFHVTRQITKRSLGVHYVAWSGVVLGAVLLAQIIAQWASRIPIWAVTGLVPALALITAWYWLPQINLDDSQIWLVAQCGALGLASVTTLVVGTQLFSVLINRPLVQESSIIASHITTGAIVGVLAGALWQTNSTNERMAVRTDVLNRVLRHNLRNDLSVVFGHLEAIRETADEPQQSQIDISLRKLDDLIELTEKVRQVDTAMARGRGAYSPVDLVACIDRRLAEIERTHQAATVHTDCPQEAWVLADGMLGTLLENVVESAVVHGDGDPTLLVDVSTTPRRVQVRIEDHGGTLPAADLAVVSAGRETKLEHGCGIELWLVDWLVERYDGDLAITETATGESVIEITLVRADTSLAVFQGIYTP